MAYAVEFRVRHPNLREGAGDAVSAIFTNRWPSPPAITSKRLKAQKIPGTAQDLHVVLLEAV
jgi:hypothetical protein